MALTEDIKTITNMDNLNSNVDEVLQYWKAMRKLVLSAKVLQFFEDNNWINIPDYYKSILNRAPEPVTVLQGIIIFHNHGYEITPIWNVQNKKWKVYVAKLDRTYQSNVNYIPDAESEDYLDTLNKAMEYIIDNTYASIKYNMYDPDSILLSINRKHYSEFVRKNSELINSIINGTELNHNKLAERLIEAYIIPENFKNSVYSYEYTVSIPNGIQVDVLVQQVYHYGVNNENSSCTVYEARITFYI